MIGPHIKVKNSNGTAFLCNPRGGIIFVGPEDFIDEQISDRDLVGVQIMTEAQRLAHKENQDDLERPRGLSFAGNLAYETIMEVMKTNEMTNVGGCKAFYSPREWAERGEYYGTGSELIIVHDGGALAYFCNLDYMAYNLHDALQSALAEHGLFCEQCTSYYSAVYKG